MSKDRRWWPACAWSAPGACIPSGSLAAPESPACPERCGTCGDNSALRNPRRCLAVSWFSSWLLGQSACGWPFLVSSGRIHPRTRGLSGTTTLLAYLTWWPPQQLTAVGAAAPPSGLGRHSHQAQCLQDSRGLSPKIRGAVSARLGVKDVFEEAAVFSDASSLRGAGRASTLLFFFCWEIIFLLACKQEL